MIPDIQDMIGKPYAEGGRGPSEYDCAGVILEILKRAGFDPGDFTRDPMAAENEWIEDPIMSPLSVFQIASDGKIAEHLALHLGGRLLIHANEEGVGIVPASSFPNPKSVVKYVGP